MNPQKHDDEKAAERVFLNQSDIENELAKNPSWMSFYSAQAAKWQAIADLKHIEARERRGLVLKEMQSAGEKITGDTLKAAQESDPEYVKFCKQEVQAREQADTYKGTFTALDKKQFSLQSLNKRNDREEQVTKARSFQELNPNA